MSIVSPGKALSVLVTGSTGFLGSRLVEALVARGYQVRALARKTSNIEQLQKLNVEICYGDVADRASLEPAFADINFVVHAAADTRGDKIESLRTTINGTQNIVALSAKYKIDKLIYISSCSVYGVSELREGQIVDENAPLERHPEKRGFYSEAKQKAEKLFLDTAESENIPFVCLRPGTIYGPGGEVFTPMMGFSVGTKLFAIIGKGDFVLPLVYIDNLIEAIIKAIQKTDVAGTIYNVVDPDRLTKRQYVSMLLKKLYPKARYITIPYTFLYLVVALQEIGLGILKCRPFLTRHRLTSSQKSIIYDSSKVGSELNWGSIVSAKEGLNRIFEYETGKNRPFAQ